MGTMMKRYGEGRRINFGGSTRAAGEVSSPYRYHYACKSSECSPSSTWMAMISGESWEANSSACLAMQLQRSIGTTTMGGAAPLAGTTGVTQLVATLTM